VDIGEIRLRPDAMRPPVHIRRCYDRVTLATFAKHYETNKPLPEALYTKIVAARKFRAAYQTQRQVHFATVDLELHSSDFHPENGEESIFDREKKVAERTMAKKPFEKDRYLCSFVHVFAGMSYAAGYYSYKWAEVLSADAFSAFEDFISDDMAVREAGRRFRKTVLSSGGGVHPAEVFREFRGRDPITVPLLKQAGIVCDSS